MWWKILRTLLLEQLFRYGFEYVKNHKRTKKIIAKISKKF